jgi:hypothetical protein
MKPSVKVAACLISALCTVLASAQIPSTQGGAEAPTTSSPSAYVYVVSAVSNGAELDGYSADSNGALTRLPGSPFWTSKSQYVTGLAHTAHWLFVSDGVYIYSFSIASNGALTRKSSINAQNYTNYTCGEVGSLFLDHTGSTVYALNIYSDCANNTIQSFAKNSSTGALTYLGDTSPSAALWGPVSFIGNNLYAYNAGCIQLSSAFYAVSRSSNGGLARFLIDPPIPSNPNGNYCSWAQAADPASNLAVAFLLEGQPPAQLGVYTADSSGDLTTNSTSENMPTTAVGSVEAMKASAAGNLLAVGGTTGLQVFHFNGSNPITHYTGLLATHELRDLAWDNHNHLYGISPSSGRLYAFRVTTTGYKQATGSPYSISVPQAITVLSK